MEFIGVNNFIASFKPEIDWNKKAKRKAKDLGITVDEVKEKWAKKRDIGIKIHRDIHNEEIANPPSGMELHSHLAAYDEETGDKLIAPSINGIYPNGKLNNNSIYLERPCYSFKQGIVGIPDKIEVVKNTINIDDYKTYTNLYRTSLAIRVGGKLYKEKYNAPVAHLDACNYIDATLQLSLYMYILWENNRNLKVGKLFLTHIKTDDNGKILSKEREEVPYMREEVRTMLTHKRNNEITTN